MNGFPEYKLLLGECSWHRYWFLPKDDPRVQSSATIVLEGSFNGDEALAIRDTYCDCPRFGNGYTGIMPGVNAAYANLDQREDYSNVACGVGVRLR